MITWRALLYSIGRTAGLGVTAAAMHTLGIAGIAHAQDWAPSPTLPLPALAKLRTNPPENVTSAIARVPYDLSNKVDFENLRFRDGEQIFGWLTFVGHPSSYLPGDRGILLGFYNSGANAEQFVQPGPDQPIAAVWKLSSDPTNPAAINRNKMSQSLGPWPDRGAIGSGSGQEGHINQPACALLQQPVGGIHFAGAHASQTPCWLEGNTQSARARASAITTDAIRQQDRRAA